MIKCGIVGIGKMGEALLKGLMPEKEKGNLELFGYEILKERKNEIQQKYNIALEDTLEDLLKKSDVIFICVKPHQVRGLFDKMGNLAAGKLFISVAAGVPLKKLREWIWAEAKLVRAMPNTPALVGEGAIAYSLGDNCGPDDKILVEKLLSLVGMVVEVDESLMNAVTALSGSGPAYMFLMIEALCAAGVRMGIPRELSLKLTLKTMKGSLKLIETMQKHPAEMIDMVTSPGGTTIAALHKLERAGFKGIIMDALKAAQDRASELEG